jgi:hypothetical protein
LCTRDRYILRPFHVYWPAWFNQVTAVKFDPGHLEESLQWIEFGKPWDGDFHITRTINSNVYVLDLQDRRFSGVIDDGTRITVYMEDGRRTATQYWQISSLSDADAPGGVDDGTLA